MTQAARGSMRDTNQDQDKKMAFPGKLAGASSLFLVIVPVSLNLWRKLPTLSRAEIRYGKRQREIER